MEVSWFTNAIIAAAPSGQTFIVEPAVGALLVIAPNDEFAAAADSFNEHKRRTGIPTFLHVSPPVELSELEHQAYFLKGLIASAAGSLWVRWVVLLGDASLIPTAHRCTTQIPEQ